MQDLLNGKCFNASFSAKWSNKLNWISVNEARDIIKTGQWLMRNAQQSNERNVLNEGKWNKKAKNVFESLLKALFWINPAQTV